MEGILGENLKTLRLQKNFDQKSFSLRAGISVTALKHLESGEGASIKTLVRVVHALERDDWIRKLAPQVTINPLYVVKNKAVRQRASRKLNGKKKNTL